MGLTPVKVNAVLMPGVNDDQASPLLAFCLDNGYELRFIEYMPLGPRGSWKREDMITAEDILDMLEKDFTLTPLGDTVRGPPQQNCGELPKASTPRDESASLLPSRARLPAARATARASPRTARSATAYLANRRSTSWG